MDIVYTGIPNFLARNSSRKIGRKEERREKGREDERWTSGRERRKKRVGNSGMKEGRIYLHVIEDVFVRDGTDSDESCII